MTFETIRIERDERVGIITLDQPKRMNAISLTMADEFKRALGELEADETIRVIVVKGEGGRAFSSGYDIAEEAEGERYTAATWSERLNHDLDFTLSVWECRKPTLAAIEGYCLAGGMEFAGMCDIRYCSEEAKFGVVDTRFSSGVATLILPWIVGSQCRELIYTSDIFDAERAERVGFVTRVFPKETLAAEVVRIAKRMSMVAGECLRLNKKAINQSFEIMGLMGALKAGVDAAALLNSMETPEYLDFDRIKREQGMKAALKWRAEQFKPYE
ncbi:enoyl-CoA hydratase/isomerase family protein [Pararhizobium mangrovi]|uniref:Enoyl-CoA hydratase/isomerase family protein n=1 Tax=Pararhizobium mangrovi TaxID=2590452 RepID=A0A506TYH5_9HYPH|nr:enoyl-CoA hydratase/isomerase family protein [Pararhizobium mangrovi]TPW25765.1 enoyl-CoA hydratase/isomerase family protein [Pararhizobium mangrovi]